MSDRLPAQTAERVKDGSINEQGVWKYIREVNSTSRSRLRATAIIDCTREYTYEQMFAEWERYARVFSSLGMTGGNGSRVAIGGSISAEPLFAFYALNMTGAEVSMFSYPDFLPGGQWMTMAKAERITDLVISDIMVAPDAWPSMLQAKEELGIRNIVLLHSRLGGPCAGPAELIYNEVNHHLLRELDGTVFMSDLLSAHQDAAIRFGEDDPQRIAVITHTSGTTKGTRKPLPYTNKSVNTATTDFVAECAVYFVANDEDARANTPCRIAPSYDFSSFLCMAGCVNTFLAMGNTIVLTFFGFMHPKFVRAVEHYRLNILFTSGFMLDSWIKRTDLDDVDFSSLISLACGGSYLSPRKLRQYEDFAHAHGYAGTITRAYGMSETGGAQISVPPGCHDDIMGFPQPEEDYLVYDEEDGAYHRAGEGERTGILHVASRTMCLNSLDGQTLFDFVDIGGRDFMCTNDLVRVNPNGSLSYAGRADRFFANNEGVRFNPGIVEQSLASQPQVAQCAVVPVLDKRIHDTVPVLYVVPETKGPDAAERVRDALVTAYVTEGLVATSGLPSQLVVVDSIPCNANGKVDIYRITRDRLQGEAYDILPVRTNGDVTDVSLELNSELSSMTGGTLPEGMGNGSALGIYDLFNGSFAGKSPTFAFPPLLPAPFRLTQTSDPRRTSYMDTNAAMPAMQLMQQACTMHMQVFQNMCMMPLYLMQNATSMMSLLTSAICAASDTTARQGGFKLGGMEVPPELLGMLLNIDMSPEDLEKLQGVLDFVFEAMPRPNAGTR